MGKKTDLESVHLVNHSKCMLAAFHNFRQDETMLDVTLVCNGLSIKAHKLILSACSPFFKQLFIENPCTHPIIILRDFEFSDLKAIVDFIYKGELSVPRERLMSALKVAEELQIRGLRRSEPNREKYEKLYNQVCGKLSGRKKRKRHRRNSTDSEKNNYVNLSDSDQDIESDDSLVARKVASGSQPMEIESVDEANSTNDRDIRPVVLRVGDPSVSNEESVSNAALEQELNPAGSEEKNLMADESQAENISIPKEQVDEEAHDAVSERNTSHSQLDSHAAFSDNSNLHYVPREEQNNLHEQCVQSLPDPENSVEQSSLFSTSSLQVNTSEAQQSDENSSHDEGKRFVCSKCESVFSSRINFMRHKALGHNNVDKTYECEHCAYTSEDMDSFKSHLLTHSDKVPYKCNICSEEFSSEEVYQKHLCLHEVEEIAFRGFSQTSGQELFSTQNKSAEKNLEFRCSICFAKFSSKLRCQIHEKSCQGGS